jgi:hypothetical protein
MSKKKYKKNKKIKQKKTNQLFPWGKGVLAGLIRAEIIM